MGGLPSRSAPRDHGDGGRARPQPYAPVSRPPPKPKPTQAELLAAAEAQINDIMQQGVTFWATCTVGTLEEAQKARKKTMQLNEGLLQQQLVLDGITEETLRPKRRELTVHLQPQMDELEAIIADLDQKIAELEQTITTTTTTV